MSRLSPVTHPSAWLGAEMVADRSWQIHFTPDQQSDIRTALQRACDDELGFADLTADTFVLPHCAGLLQEVRSELRDGRGFVLLRGFPVEGMSVADAELAYWGLCIHLGTPVTQNADSEFLVHITDKGAPRGTLSRGYATAAEAKFHIDLTDVVGLLCLRQAKVGGRSRIASSIAAMNAVIRERPDLLPVLCAGFPWDRRDEHAEGEPSMGPSMPIFSQHDGLWACRYNRGFIEAAYRRRGETMAPQAAAALDFLDAAIARPEHVLEMDFQAGDIQLLSNDTVLHARTAFVDAPQPDRKRLLLRAWLQMTAPRPLADPALLRDAMVRYGNLGRAIGEGAVRGP